MAAVPVPNTPHPTPLGEDPVLWLRLIRSRRVGPVTFHRLIEEHGGVAAALRALPEVAAAAGIANYELCPEGVVLAEMRQARKVGARLILHGDVGYPSALAGLADAPPVLWVRGDAALLTRSAVALIGARNASSLGLRMARRLGAALGAAGQVVVSGLARGIDAEAHRAALATGTVAVVAGGVDVVYPEDNADLSRMIVERGCLVSEQPMGTLPQARHFPARNRIVSGLARAVVVVEAAAGSGSLITARLALDQGREVMAVPGHPFDARAAGCNGLIRDGALLIRGAEDVVEALGPEAVAAPDPAPAARPAGSEPAASAGLTGGPASAAPTPRPVGASSADRSASSSAPPSASEREVSPTAAPLPGARRTVPSASGREASLPPAGPATAGADDPSPTYRHRSIPRSPQPERFPVSATAPTSGPVGRVLPQPVPIRPDPPPAAALGDLQDRILARLGPSPLPEDHMIRDLALPAAVISPALVALEIEGWIERQPGGLLCRPAKD